MPEPIIISDYKAKKLRLALQDLQNSVHEYREGTVEPTYPDCFDTQSETLDEIRTLLGLGEFKYTGVHGDAEPEADAE